MRRLFLLFFFLSAGFAGFAGFAGLQADDFDFFAFFRDRADALQSEAVRLRRELHQIPELCFQEKRAAAFAERYLRGLGLEVQAGLAGTGIKAVLRGGRPGGRPGRIVALRADMDALPIQETTGEPWASKNPGTMHACGHDVHMTNLLIAARILVEARPHLSGTVIFIFQPCEEGAPEGRPGGADTLIAQGVLENPPVEAMIGLHLLPALPLGKACVQAGPVMANVASVFIKIFGKASHGALPHQGIDAIYAAALAVVEFQALISRSRDPNEKAVLSVGTIHGGSRLNVVAAETALEGTVRTFSFALEDQIGQGMERILKGLEIALGISYRFDFIKVNRFVKNDAQLVEQLLPEFRRALGRENVVTIDPLTIGEDFAAYSHRLPALFFFLGTGSDTALHTPDFSVDERILTLGPRLLASAAAAYLCRSTGSCSD